MGETLVADLGIGPDIWLFLALLACVTLFFKFGRFWSMRNLDLLLLFAPAPGMMVLVGHGVSPPWIAFVWLFLGSGLWLLRCLLDLGLARRPLLEPNLNAWGLATLSIGILGLLLAETISLPVSEGAKRNPAETVQRDHPTAEFEGQLGAAPRRMLALVPLSDSLKSSPPQVIFARVLAMLGHVAIVMGLFGIGRIHFERPIAGLAAVACYLLLPYTRIAVVDAGQVVPAALITAAIRYYDRPLTAGVLVGLAAGWMPACLGLLPLWAGFYRQSRGMRRFAEAAVGVALLCGATAWLVPDLAHWAQSLGARTLAETGLWPGVNAPRAGSFWTGIDASYRLPVLVLYVALVVVTTIWPRDKNLGELIALSAAILIASQFWYLEAGGTLVLLYLPLLVLIMFRPNLAAKRPTPRVVAAKPEEAAASLAR